jgi:hypothetical protein
VTMRALIRVPAAALLGIAAAVLVSCGSSGKGLIPEANAGPLQSDFEAVAQAARAGDGSCTATVAAINKTERDFAALPASVDQALRGRLSQGISNLREHALALCAQPLVQTTTTSRQRTTTTTTPAKTQPTSTTPPTTQTTSSQTTATPPAASTPPDNGGGTAAPRGAGGENEGGQGAGAGESGGAGVQEGTK